MTFASVSHNLESPLEGLGHALSPGEIVLFWSPLARSRPSLSWLKNQPSGRGNGLRNQNAPPTRQTPVVEVVYRIVDRIERIGVGL